MEKIHKIIAGLALALFASLNAAAQQPDFFTIDRDPTTLHYGTCAIEAPDGCFFIASETAVVYDHAVLYKLSPNGEILKRLAVGETYSTVAGLFADPDDENLYYAVGHRANSQGTLCPYIFKFDCDLKAISLLDITIPDDYNDFFSSSAILDHDNNVIFTATYPPPSGPVNQLHVAFALDGTLLQCVTQRRLSFFDSMFTLPGSEIWCYSFNILYRINDSLLMDQVHEYTFVVDEPEGNLWHTVQVDGTFYPSAVALPDSSFIFANTAYEWWIEQYGGIVDSDHEQMVFFKSDFEGQVEKTIIVGSHDTLEMPAYRRAIAYQSPDSIYLCAFQNVEPTSFGGIVMGNKIFMKKVDRNMNVIWERDYILGPEHFDPVYILATHDGGCLIVGRIFYDQGMSDCDMFVLKIAEDGSWGTDENTKGSLRPYAYYPNPADDELHLYFSPDVTPTQIELYDLQGRLVKTQRTGLESLNLQGIAAGTYTMRVTLEGGKAFSDKVVKE